MIKILLLTFAVTVLSIAQAATYTVSLIEPAVVKGQNLKPGDYRMEVKDSSVILTKGKQHLEVSAKIEDGHEKFDRTQVLYNENKGKFSIQEIHLGGTATKVTLDPEVPTGK